MNNRKSQNQIPEKASKPDSQEEPLRYTWAACLAYSIIMASVADLPRPEALWAVRKALRELEEKPVNKNHQP